MTSPQPSIAAASDEQSEDLLRQHALAEKRALYDRMVELFRRDLPNCPDHVFKAYCVVLAEEIGL